MRAARHHDGTLPSNGTRRLSEVQAVHKGRPMKRRQRSGQTPSEGEATLALMLRVEGIAFEREYRAIPSRKFRWDFFISPDLLIEVQGGVWNFGKSGHSSGAGITRDAEKSSLAVTYGFRPITATTAQVKSGEALEWIKQAIRRVA